MSIVDKWIERANEKYGSRQEGIDKLNQVCGKKIRPSELSAMKSGKRGVPKCVYHMMLIDVLLTQLEKSGWENASLDMDYKEYTALIESILPPDTWTK